VYLVVDGVKYWIMLGPSGPTLYRREGSRTMYLGRRPIAEVKEMLAKAGAEAVQRIKAELEAVKQAVESQKPAQKAQTAQTLTWKKDGHIYWLLQYGRTFYVYMKGPSTRHKPRLVEKTDVSGVIGRVVAAGAMHVLEALRALVNGLYAAVVDLLRLPAEAREESKKSQTPQVSRREAEEAFRRLRGELRREVEKWRERWRREDEERGYWGEPDDEWLRERLSDFVDAYLYLLEKIAPYQDLVDKFADAVVEAAAGRLTRRDVLDILKEL
jgi:AcrR family transcriptional regulator